MYICSWKNPQAVDDDDEAFNWLKKIPFTNKGPAFKMLLK